jgi:hypothetical protein
VEPISGGGLRSKSTLVTPSDCHGPDEAVSFLVELLLEVLPPAAASESGGTSAEVLVRSLPKEVVSKGNRQWPEHLEQPLGAAAFSVELPGPAGATAHHDDGQQFILRVWLPRNHIASECWNLTLGGPTWTGPNGLDRVRLRDDELPRDLLGLTGGAAVAEAALQRPRRDGHGRDGHRRDLGPDARLSGPRARGSGTPTNCGRVSIRSRRTAIRLTGGSLQPCSSPWCRGETEQNVDQLLRKGQRQEVLDKEERD